MTAIARRPSMSARYLVTADPPAAQGRATGSRCNDGRSPSQKDTGRTGWLYQNEQEACGPLLAKRVFVENVTSAIHAPTGSTISTISFAISSPARARARTAPSAMVTAALDRHRRVANADREMMETLRVNHADARKGVVRSLGPTLARRVPPEHCAPYT